MKNTILLFAFLFSISGFSQIGDAEKVSENTIIGYNWKMKPNIELARTDVTNSEKKSYHIISYQNAKYTTITDFRAIGFYADTSDLDKLFEMLLEVYTTGNEITFTLGESTLIVSKNKWLSVYVSEQSKTDSFFLLNKRQLERLFGKR
jgi:hypothetical protein